jgi:hypothetical protein
MLLLSPMAVNADWKALKLPGNMNVCTLETENEKMPDGYSETKVKLRLTPDALVINTNSNIDLSFNDVGLVVDNKEFIPATDVRDEKNVVFSSDLDTIIQQFIKGLRVTLHIRYWPTYPTTNNFKISFSLIGFTKAYHEYESCMANTL